MQEITGFLEARKGLPRHGQDGPVDPEEEAREGWKTALRQAIRDPKVLLDLLRLPSSLLSGARAGAERFPLLVPRGYLARMQIGDPADPLLRQVLPLGDEEAILEGYTADPVGDGAATVVPGLIQKYAGRVLLVTSGSCAVNCRYCFRRHFPYGETPRGEAAWAPALERIAGDPSVTEVILSGGDPLVLGDAALARFGERLASIPHVHRLRVHTRMPIVVPERVTPGLLDILRRTRLTPVIVVHANHPAELKGKCADRLQAIRDAGILLLNQAVLLRGVNDHDETLVKLSERLLEVGVLPYYLHQLDPVEGAAHFAVSESRGLALMARVAERLPGYGVPRYVKEIPGAPGKQDVRG